MTTKQKKSLENHRDYLKHRKSRLKSVAKRYRKNKKKLAKYYHEYYLLVKKNRSK